MKNDIMQEIIETRINENGDFSKIQDRINVNKYVKQKRHFINKNLAVGLSSLILVGSFTMVVMNKSSNDLKWEKIILNSPIDKEPQTSYLLRWDEKNIIQKYSELQFNETKYEIWSLTNSLPIPKEYIGDNIGTSEISGYDTYNEQTHVTQVQLYEIKKVDKDFAIAVCFYNDEGEENNYYGFVNWNKKFDNLEFLLTSLNLREYGTYKKAYYKYVDKKEEEHLISFEDYEDSIIWETMFSNDNLNNVFFEESETLPKNKNTVFSIRLSIEALGIFDSNAHYLAFDNEGFMYINLCPSTDNKNIFYVGKDKINDLIDYYINKVKGYEIVYDDNISSPGSTTTEPDSSNSILTSEGYNPR